MQVARDTLVTIAVKMYDLQKNLLETADDLVYLHGHGDIFPVIEKALEGKNPGDTVSVQLEPEEAFGDYDETALMIRPETDFPGGVEVGLRYTEIRGETLDRPYRVTDIADGVVVLDGNHPLAGIGLKFDIKVVNVEPAGDASQAVGNDDVVVPSFLQVTDKPVDPIDID
ncbi:MAG TPA: hypothetical protein IAC66_04495 [Candidatus Aphodousia gallistercoris]|nr:hypothetical protein [Candidatus Aphodousia gallistercoris]